MYQILYKSECRIPEENLEKEIKSILAAAAVNNTRDGITGLFLLIENRFLQLMEGEEADVKKCMERIKNDTRHSELTILMQRPIPRRLFPKWSMHFSRLNGSQALEKLGASKMQDLGITQWQDNFKDNLAIMLLESFARLGNI
jgi:hypothetical protein